MEELEASTTRRLEKMENDVTHDMYNLKVNNEKKEECVDKNSEKKQELSIKHRITFSRITKVEQEIKALQERHQMCHASKKSVNSSDSRESPSYKKFASQTCEGNNFRLSSSNQYSKWNQEQLSSEKKWLFGSV